MSSRSASRILGLAMAAPALAWFAYQQGLGAILRVDCARGGAGAGLLLGAAALAICAGSALCARLGLGPAGEEPRRQTLHLLAILTVSSAGLFGLAILFQMAASAIIPPCAR